MRIDTTIFGTASLLALALGGAADETLHEAPAHPDEPPADFAGVWRNADGSVRLCLGDDWSYEGRVEGRDRSARGTYVPAGRGLVLQDDSGLRTTVYVADHGLEMAGHQLFKV